MTVPAAYTPADMPGSSEFVARQRHLDSLVSDTMHVFHAIRDRVGDIDTALTLTDITLNRKDPHV